ncbi:MAG: MTH1187 family thiamine-binding protein [Selenomonadaceae bacterium]|nr:MTH1187 family thiamine-binding protein [Selenomonadaceae bacterium]MBQ9497792.1 MTH1187 family thiamine-binding protein [Selenomonadaceae bacterium]
MNTLIAVSIAPVGVGEELSRHVAEVVKVIRESGLPNKTSSMFTEIEGEWDAVMDVVKRATFVLAEKGIRTEVVLKADIRPNFSNMMEGKLDRLNEAMEEKPQPVEEKPQPQQKPQSVEDRIRDTLHRIGGKR